MKKSMRNHYRHKQQNAVELNELFQIRVMRFPDATIRVTIDELKARKGIK